MQNQTKKLTGAELKIKTLRDAKQAINQAKADGKVKIKQVSI